MFSAPRPIQAGPRALQDTFLGSKRFQERPESLSRGLSRAPASKTRFGTCFGRVLDLFWDAPGLDKYGFRVRRPAIFAISRFSDRVASGARFWTLPGSVLGVIWPPIWLKPVLRFLLECPRAAQEIFFSGPEASKSAPAGQLEGKIRARKGQQEPRGLQEGSGDHFGHILAHILEPSWGHLGSILEQF